MNLLGGAGWGSPDIIQPIQEKWALSLLTQALALGLPSSERETQSLTSGILCPGEGDTRPALGKYPI